MTEKSKHADVDQMKGVFYDGARVPQELMGVLADASALLPNGLPGTLTLDGELAKVSRGAGDWVCVEPVSQPGVRHA